jgi:SAM-dependent methyltransferase
LSVFGAYSHYYDLLYEEKNYAKEVEFVSAIIRRHAPDAKTMLDLGCGTGRHAWGFTQKGYRVTGLDRSAEMLAKAREREERGKITSSEAIEFQQGDIRDFELSRRFDAVVALFHVIGYLPANQELDAAFTRIRRHLNGGGLLVFDHWYGPAVLTERPTPRIKTFENDELKIIRIATPTLLMNDNLVDVRYDLVVIDKISRLCREIVETHRVRYFFWPEIESLLARNGLERVEFGEWLSGRVPDHSSWNTYVAATGRAQIA